MIRRLVFSIYARLHGQRRTIFLPKRSLMADWKKLGESRVQPLRKTGTR